MTNPVITKQNRLALETSPYLLQHANNPVNWFPWGEEAFQKASAEDKPIFLSIGYSTCHWCHVMERESFENREIAEIMNRNYVCIKVDREERPDLDELYMSVTQMVTGNGGWPNSIWLTPDRRPWYAGTYFPPKDRYNIPGFGKLLTRLADIWDTRREDVESQADELTKALKQSERVYADLPTAELNESTIDRAIYQLESHFDNENGGFGTAPKSPPHVELALLAYQCRKDVDVRHLEMLSETLGAMARGGIYDQIGGGFHRYSTDTEWFLPHFEKMLYDNAQLIKAYVDGYLLTGEGLFRHIARQTADWVLRDMTSPEGVFYSALDADSEGVEGKFYLWTAQEVEAILGEEAPLFSKVYGVSEAGNYFTESTGEPTSENILLIDTLPEEVADSEDMEVAEVEKILAECRMQLLNARNKRVWPGLDDKSLTGWNGLMIGSLAYAGAHLGENRYIDAAKKAADFILGSVRGDDGALFRSYRQGKTQIVAYLEDYVFLTDGLLQLYEVTGEDKYFKEAIRFTEAFIDEFEDKQAGGFYLSSEAHKDVLLRTKDPYDKAIPSGNGTAANVLLDLWHLLKEKNHVKAEEYLEKAKSTVEAFAPLIERVPLGAKSLLLATERYLDAKRTAERYVACKTNETGIRVKPVTLSHRSNAVDGLVEITFHLSIDEGWHINSNDSLTDLVIPTAIVPEDESCIEDYEASYPKGQMVSMSFVDEPISVYQDSVDIPMVVRLKKGCEAQSLRFKLSFQPCNERTCGLPETVEITVSLNKTKIPS